MLGSSFRLLFRVALGFGSNNDAIYDDVNEGEGGYGIRLYMWKNNEEQE